MCTLAAMARKRGAVVIGVSKTGGLPVEVKTITDARGPVTPQHIADAINAFIAPGTYHQLVIYFSGHGYWKNDAELWLLTNAPADANAAVSWVETAEFAKDCGIPNVVLISDACRSIPDTPQKMKVRGSVVFPNDDVPRPRAKVDKFMAAATGRPAYEISIGANGQKESAFTHCFLRAFEAPDRDMILKVTDDGEVIDVVPNRRLGKYLQREVSNLLASVNVQLDQVPDAEVLSDDDVYLGRARVTAEVAERGEPESKGPPGGPIVNLRDVATMAIDRALDVETLARASGFDDALAQPNGPPQYRISKQKPDSQCWERRLPRWQRRMKQEQPFWRPGIAITQASFA
jgi:hypothetical protein